MLDYRRYNREYAERIRLVLPTTPADDAYRARMNSRYGAARTAEILNAGGTHALIFPNLTDWGADSRAATCGGRSYRSHTLSDHAQRRVSRTKQHAFARS
jgi:hypothetical protein